MANRVREFLVSERCRYDLVAHQRTGSSTQSAQAAHVPGAALAKAVVVKDREGYALAVLPATRHIVFSRLDRAMRGRPFELASEAEAGAIFPDCDLGAVPPLGRAYGLPMIVDETLDGAPEVYFEAGDHEHLVRMQQAEFYRLTSDAPRARFSQPDDEEEPLWTA